MAFVMNLVLRKHDIPDNNNMQKSLTTEVESRIQPPAGAGIRKKRKIKIRGDICAPRAKQGIVPPQI